MTTITGLDAIAHATATGEMLRKHADPVDGAREVSTDEAREIVREDAGLIYCEAPETRTITVAIDTACRHGGEPLIWGVAEGDDSEAAIADAATWLAEGEAVRKSHRAEAEALDVVTIPWPASERLPDGGDRRAIALAMDALNTCR